MLHVQLVDAGLGASVKRKTCRSANWGAVNQLQLALNTALRKSGLSRIKVDGLLGQGTVTAVNTVLGTSFTSCDAVVPRIAELTKAVMLRTASVMPDVLTPPKPTSALPDWVPPTGLSPTPAAGGTKSKISPYVILAGGGMLALLGLGVMWYRRRQ